MAKKNLSSLMDRILGDDNAQVQVFPPAPEITEQMNAGLHAKRYEKAGRPKKGETKENSKDIRATIIVNSDLMRKIKYISLIDEILIKDVIGDALTKHIEDWENANGRIKLPSKK